MANILSQQQGITIKSDTYQSWDEFLKQLPGADELAKEKALAEKIKSTGNVQKYAQPYKKQEENQKQNSKKGVSKRQQTPHPRPSQIGRGQYQVLKQDKIQKVLSSLSEYSIKNEVFGGKIITLAHAASVLSGYYLTEIAIQGKAFPVTSWGKALKLFLFILAKNYPRLIQKWKTEGLLTWVNFTKTESGTSVMLIPGHQKSIVEWQIAKLQWLILKCRLKLGNVTLNLKSKKRLKSGMSLQPIPCHRYCYPKSKNSQEPETSLLGHEEMFRKQNSHLDNHSVAWIEGGSVTNENKGKPHETRRKTMTKEPPSKNLITTPSAKLFWVTNTPSSEIRYIVENGVVVRLGRGTTGNHEVARSSSDAEDTWIGMGHFARDNGRFGSIDGVDYAD